jgi:hypothetical protein
LRDSGGRGARSATGTGGGRAKAKEVGSLGGRTFGQWTMGDDDPGRRPRRGSFASRESKPPNPGGFRFPSSPAARPSTRVPTARESVTGEFVGTRPQAYEPLLW